MSKQEGEIWRALGLMSGTSLDGIDVAVIDTDGYKVVRRAATATYPYSEAFREKLRAGLVDATGISQRDERPGRLRLLEQYLTELHAEAISNYLEDHQIQADSIDIIGFHGQTVLHRPEAGLTVQIGDGELLAKLTGRDVVYDMRAADVAAGGQGAPLVSAYHRAIAAHIAERPIVVLNIGGVANVTWIGGDGSLLAFDTGPGNALINDWVETHTGAPHDKDGAMAAAGAIHEAILAQYCASPYFSALPPKSRDRNAFSLDPVAGLSLEDGAATLTAFTATTIAKAREHFREEPALWVVCGGGRRNKTLMTMIAGRVEGAVVPAEALGLDGDAVEAEAWAFLAVRSALGLPLTFPGTTGVATPCLGGRCAKANPGIDG